MIWRNLYRDIEINRNPRSEELLKLEGSQKIFISRRGVGGGGVGGVDPAFNNLVLGPTFQVFYKPSPLFISRKCTGAKHMVVHNVLTY